MMRNGLGGFLAILLVVATVLYVVPTTKAQPPLPAIWVEPTTLNFNTTSTHVGDKFNVTAWAGTTSDVFTYQVEILFNATQLAAVRAAYTGGATSQWWKGHATIPATLIIDNATGTILGGESLLGADVVHASNGSLFWVEFQILVAPTLGNTLTSLIDTNDPTSSYLLDTDLNTMTGVTLNHATYTFSGGSPPPPTSHDVAVTGITLSSDHPGQGDLVSIGAAALNNGTVTETFNVNVTYDGTLIGVQTATSLASGSTQTLTFTWNTTGVAAGNYTITATAVPVAGETDLSNNAKTANVTVLMPRHEAAVTSVTPSSDHVNQGNSLSILVVVLNNGTVTETFDVNATYDSTLIGKQTVTSLAAGSTQTLTFTWNTTHVAVGNYTVTATATPVAGQTDLRGISKSVAVLVQTPPIILNTVTFTESGLAQGSQWSITFNSQTNISASSLITFKAPNGVYPYSVTGPTDFTASPPNGSVSVNGQNVAVNITFLSVIIITGHDVAVTGITVSPNPAFQGGLVSVSLVVLNNGTSVETSFAVNVTYDGTLIGKQTVASLAAGDTQTLSFGWNTTGVTAGYYTVTAAAAPVAGETDLSNNVKAATVQIEVPTVIQHFFSGSLPVFLAFFLSFELIGGSVSLLFLGMLRERRKKRARRHSVKVGG